jgi:hypothetical protein
MHCRVHGLMHVLMDGLLNRLVYGFTRMTADVMVNIRADRIQEPLTEVFEVKIEVLKS